MKTAMLSVLLAASGAIACGPETAGTTKAGESQVEETFRNPNRKVCGETWSGSATLFGGSTTDFSNSGFEDFGDLAVECAVITFHTKPGAETAMMVYMKYDKASVVLTFKGKPRLGEAYRIAEDGDSRFVAVYIRDKVPSSMASGSIAFAKYPKGKSGGLAFEWEGTFGEGKAETRASGSLRAAP